MGTKIKNILNRIIITGLICFVVNSTYAQKYSVYDYARLYSLKRCLDINYLALDSLFIQKIPDITPSLVLQVLSPEQMDDIDEIVKQKAQNFYKEPPYGVYDIPNANQICFFCWELYESKEMKKEMRIIVKSRKKYEN